MGPQLSEADQFQLDSCQIVINRRWCEWGRADRGHSHDEVVVGWLGEWWSCEALSYRDSHQSPDAHSKPRSRSQLWYLYRNNNSVSCENKCYVATQAVT